MWAKKNKDRTKITARNSYLRRHFDLSPDEFDVLVEKQESKCAICRQPPHVSIDSLGRTRSWHIDHDHITHKVRALLCHNCNVGLGLFRDSPELLKKAANYLEGKERACVRAFV